MKTIGIIGALECEVETIKNNFKEISVKSNKGINFYICKNDNYNIILMQSGMGKVSAAIGAQMMIDMFLPDCIINTGCAGSLNNEVKCQDVVISTTAVEWDLDTIAIGNPRGYISSMNCVYLNADSRLVDVISRFFLEQGKIHTGLIVSGDQFVSSDHQRDLIKGEFANALCAEMEGASIAHVCVQNGIPFCIVRSISDNANEGANLDFLLFSKLAGEKSANVLVNLLSKNDLLNI